jgi:hypothetical protein
VPGASTKGDEFLGTLLVVGGGMAFIAGLSLCRHDPEIAGEGAMHAFVEAVLNRR